MHVSIDQEKCQGHARCEAICPEVFALDEEGVTFLLLSEVPPELVDDTALAARNCPESAIVLDEANRLETQG